MTAIFLVIIVNFIFIRFEKMEPKSNWNMRNKYLIYFKKKKKVLTQKLFNNKVSS